jgi:hypothetical protein
MKNFLIFLGLFVALLSGCTTNKKITKSTAYNGIYNEQPVSILIMPPINRSTNVEAKEYFHTTLNVPIINAGYYVIPPFLSMEILKKESAYDSELFLDIPLTKFAEVFGADLALFTIIHKWDKSGLAAKVYVEVEYILKSTKTNEIVYTRRGDVTYNTAVSSGSGGAYGALVDIAASAVATAVTKYIDVARVCNSYTFKDLPAGKYSPSFNIDGDQLAGPKEFKVLLNSQYK